MSNIKYDVVVKLIIAYLILLICAVSVYSYNIKYHKLNNKQYVIVNLPYGYIDNNTFLKQYTEDSAISDLSLRVPKYSTTCLYDAWVTIITGVKALADNRLANNRCSNDILDNNQLNNGICTNKLFNSIQQKNNKYYIVNQEIKYSTFLNYINSIYLFGNGPNLMQCSNWEYSKGYLNKNNVFTLKNINEVRDINKNDTFNKSYLFDLSQFKYSSESDKEFLDDTVKNIFSLSHNNKNIIYFNIPVDSRVLPGSTHIYLYGENQQYKSLYSKSTDSSIIHLTDILSVFDKKNSNILLSKSHYSTKYYNTLWHNNKSILNGNRNINIFFAIIIIISFILFVLIKRNKFIKYVQFIIINILMMFFYILLLGIIYKYYDITYLTYIILLLSISFLSTFAISKLFKDKYDNQLLVVVSLLYIMISTDIILHNIFSVNGLFGFSINTASRFYGLDNNMLGIYIIVIGLIINKLQENRITLLIFSLLTVIIFLLFGVKFGGSIAIMPLLLEPLFKKVKYNNIKKLYIFISLLVGLLLIFLFSVIIRLSDSDNHISNFILHFNIVDYKYMLLHKMYLNINTYMHSPFNFIGLFIFLIIFYYNYKNNRIICLIFISLLLSMFIEDSGIFVINYALFALMPIMLYRYMCNKAEKAFL